MNWKYQTYIANSFAYYWSAVDYLNGRYKAYMSTWAYLKPSNQRLLTMNKVDLNKKATPEFIHPINNWTTIQMNIIHNFSSLFFSSIRRVSFSFWVFLVFTDTQQHTEEALLRSIYASIMGFRWSTLFVHFALFLSSLVSYFVERRQTRQIISSSHFKQNQSEMERDWWRKRL